MSSILTGFEYDIFISYRQKDNKGDHWVSEFVEALKSELESTFKEDISVYFDINPTDGLLESHDVDASLKDKLKCLVFIPIISRTYCDPRSFAWEHEFKSFVEEASKDRFGLKVKLPNGNVASRVLPVRIHDLDVEDKALIENELKGPLRAIDFIYKEPGVDKPLTPADDEKKNLNNTKYRIQINRMANAIGEILHGLKKASAAYVEEIINPKGALVENKKDYEGTRIISKAPDNQNLKKWLIISLILILCISGAFAVFKIIHGSKKADDLAKLEKSIAVLPFINDSPNEENTYFINGIMEEILNNLQKIKEFRVLSRTSTEQYRGSNKPAIPEIAKKLKVNYIVEGSGQKYGNTFRLRVQVIEARNEKHIWGESFELEIRETKDIFNIQSQVAQSIAAELKATITPEENQLIEKKSTTDLTAYDFYQKGREELEKYSLDNKNTASLKKAESLFKVALEHDSSFPNAYAGLADVYWSKHGNKEFFSKNYLDSVLILCDIALSYDNQLAEAYFIKGIYYHTINKPEDAIKEYDKAIKFNPGDWMSYWGKGNVFYFYKQDFIQVIDNFEKAISLYRGSYLPWIFTMTSYTYASSGFIESARYYCQEALALDGDSVYYYYNLSDLECFQGNYKNSIEYLKKGYAIDSSRLEILNMLATNYTYCGKYKEALKYFEKSLSGGINKRIEFILSGFYSNMGYAYLKSGDKEKAEFYLSKQFEYSNKQIEIGRTTNVEWQKYYVLAMVHAVRGDEREMYINLKLVNRTPIISLPQVTLIKDNPIFNKYMNDPEFQKIVKTMESKYQAEHERVRKWLEEQGKL